MDKGQHRIAELLIKKLESTINVAEEAELSQWMAESDQNRALAEEFLNEDRFRNGVRDHWIGERIWSRLDAAIQVEELVIQDNDDATQDRKIRKLFPFGWVRTAAAAAVVGLIGLSVYFAFFQPKKPITSPTKTAVADVKAPATNRATVTLSNGQKIFLDNVANGTLAVQHNVKLQKTEDGQLSYQGKTKDIKEIEYNTLTNPRGSKVIDITLSDGTRVWLNAESSLKYPVAFIEKERNVEMIGEAYFEVAHDKAKLFKVSHAETTVEVLGTHFNVNAYDDESEIKVTLLEGSIKLSKGTENQALKPGEQGIVEKYITLNKDPDLDEVMAWKNGNFEFDGLGIEGIMRQLSRWYDIDVEYRGKVPEGHFSGIVSRSSNISQVLKIMEAADVHFSIEGKKVVVLP